MTATRPPGAGKRAGFGSSPVSAPAPSLGLRLAFGLTHVLALVLALFLGGALAAPPELAAQVQPVPAVVSVVGTVVDRVQDVPVPQVSLVLTWEGDIAEGFERPTRSALSDAAGVFIVEEVPVGIWTLRVSALGYQSLEQSVRVEGASPFTLAIRIAPEAIEVEGFVVATRRNPWLDQNGFYARQFRGMGSIYTGEELDALGLYQTTDLFRQISGATLANAGSPTSPYVVFRGNCPPDVVMDGLNMGPQVRIDDLVTPGEIEGLEVYRGAANPGLFSSNPCGSILIWTLGSAARDGRPWSYRRGLVALGIILLGVLIAR